MASDELAMKLQRRLEIEDDPTGAEAVSGSGSEQGTEEKPVTAAADSELSAKLLRRGELNDGSSEPQQPSLRVFNPYTEFKEFSRKQIRDMESMFHRYDAGKDGFIDLMELKLMMEKLEAPQTHLGLKNMIKEVDEDFDGKLSFREVGFCPFVKNCRIKRHNKILDQLRKYVGKYGWTSYLEPRLIAKDGSLWKPDIVFKREKDQQFLLIFRKAAAGELAEDSGLHVLAQLSEIDVSMEGVKGAKTFFEAKLMAINESNRFEQEIKEEQEEKKKQAEQKRKKQAAFKELQSAFK